MSTGDDQLIARNKQLEARLRKMQAHQQQLEGRRDAGHHEEIPQQFTPMLNNNNNAPVSTPLLQKANSINSYWWPSEEGGGVLAKIHMAQNPSDCSSESTKYFVWRSRPGSENLSDTRGLSAWAHAGASNLAHALTDGDSFAKFGSRVLITDNKLWPMAKGCLQGPETRECYFQPLTKCKYTDVDTGGKNSIVLKTEKDEYDRSIRTVYTANKRWFRLIRNKYSWTGLTGGDKDHSAITMIAASLAYYFRPQPWLQKEIDGRIRKSIPSDLNPERTIGVPIRRSDKCMGHNVTGSAAGELECPPLSMYLDGVKKFLSFDPLIENVIVTSEDKSACAEFLELMKKELPSLRVVLNVGDVQQGTGSGSKLESYVEGAANANVVASALTSLHLHLRARYFIITSKSTWTSTIIVLARVYGFASEIFALDIGRNKNAFAAYARSGCYDSLKR